MVMQNSLVEFTEYFLIWSGMWRSSPATSALNNKIYMLFCHLSRIGYFVFAMMLIIKILLILFGIHSSDNVFNDIAMTLIISDMNFKRIIIIRNGLQELFEYIKTEEQMIYDDPDDSIKRYYLAQCRINHRLCMYQLFNSLVTVVVYALFNCLYLGFASERFIYSMWIPVEMSYQIIAALKIFFASYGVLLNTANHNVIQCLAFFIKVRLEILQKRIRKVDENNRESIGNLIEMHQFLIRFVNDLNSSVKSLMLLEFLLDSGNLAAGMIQLLMAKSVIEILYALMYFALLFSQLFILGWNTNEINEQSFNISNAIYESNWIGQDKSTKKTLLIMLIRAQKPLTLTIGPFAPMNLRAAFMTLKGAYSYAGLMKTTYS